ncbi:phosphomethylpyrimidine synthase ThiC [Dehalogenimonas etheniformans]|uniref:Phosphomethylpyrimidine synthase n=1 Tax=Dehalogenimonas etheniformans TaxID=1536648 RepID=A0A2P5P9B1_9CHLR|nr:phosphomethylpyrimidine synthase ThiC [Dehalogenimonas etheniformans]PPD58870.1 phosphomethylpyrimidine synthase ThiC [Dehalogenimonas etheniformans]QNT76362.1 phosphomethylpyrimidine synthase ThiC [Dehalogenimonas etheniformans]
MTTQLQLARKGIITPQMLSVASAENVSPEIIREGLADGYIVIPANINHQNLKPSGIGRGLRTKVNANIGTSSDCVDLENELVKLRVAQEFGADAVMDLSTGGDLVAIRQAILQKCFVALGTVPIYDAGATARMTSGSIVELTSDDLFRAIENHAREGVDFVTVHCGVTRSVIARLKEQGRITDIVSRGGALLAGWMAYHGRENPLYEEYDRLLEIAAEYDVTLSLGDGLRPGCLADATDRAQVEELLTLGELVDRARAGGVQVMVEGPGHVPLNRIQTNIELQKSVCRNAPFYVLGPLVTDIAPGYDHITSAIGGALAAMYGADFLCYVTPAEHLSLPDAEDVKQGVIASRIAAHSADIAKGIKGSSEWDLKMARARKDLDWEAQAELSIDPELSKRRHGAHHTAGSACTMCGEFCAMELASKYLGTTIGPCS